MTLRNLNFIFRDIYIANLAVKLHEFIACKSMGFVYLILRFRKLYNDVNSEYKQPNMTTFHILPITKHPMTTHNYCVQYFYDIH